MLDYSSIYLCDQSAGVSCLCWHLSFSLFHKWWHFNFDPKVLQICYGITKPSVNNEDVIILYPAADIFNVWLHDVIENARIIIFCKVWPNYRDKISCSWYNDHGLNQWSPLMEAKGLPLEFEVGTLVDIDISPIQDKYHLRASRVSEKCLCQWSGMLMNDLLSCDMLEPEVFWYKCTFDEGWSNWLDASADTRFGDVE